MTGPLSCAAAVAFVLSTGCNRVADHGSAVEHPLPEETSVGFDLEPVEGGDGSQRWIGIYNSPGKVARFRTDFGAAETTPGKTAGEPAVRQRDGTLIPELGSDSSARLTDLQKVLRFSGAA